MLMAANGCATAIVRAPSPELYTWRYGHHRAGARHHAGQRRRRASARVVSERGIEFLFAQFVDMHGKPSAKLVPAHHLDDLLTDGAGFAGFAAGDIGQGPHDPDMIAIPDPSSLTILPWKPTVARFACDVTVEGEPWPFCPRTILRNALERAKELGFEPRIGAELEYFLLRRTEDGGIAPADPLDTLDQPCYDMRALTRNLDFVSRGLAVGHLAGVGQLRDRPRGRQRAVRAELPVRRRADHVRPGDLLPLHGRIAGAGARAARDVHAQAVREPDRQRLPLPLQPVARRREPVRVRSRPTTPAAWGCRRWPTTSSAASRPTPRHTSR